jgi:proton glutamate symport protein
MLTSKGIAGVPRAALIVLAGTLASFNIPIVGVAILLGIDQILDMGRTTVNLIGNCVATVVVARWENVFDYDKMKNFVRHEVEEGLTDEIGTFSKFWKSKKDDKELCVEQKDIEEG